MTPPLSLAHMTVMDADPIALIDAAAAAGFDAAGLRIVPPVAADRIVDVVGDVALQRRIKARLASTGLRILDVEAIWLVPETEVAALEPALDVGAELGGGWGRAGGAQRVGLRPRPRRGPYGREPGTARRGGQRARVAGHA